jgi:hypothetical protein
VFVWITEAVKKYLEADDGRNNGIQIIKTQDF